MKEPFQSNNDWLGYNEATMVQSLNPCAVSWSFCSRCLISVLSRSFHRCPIKHSMRCKLRQGPKEQANLGGSGACSPGKFWNFRYPKTRFSVLWGETRQNKSFMTIKFDCKLRAGIPFKCMYTLRSAVDRIKEPGSKSWTSDHSCLNLDRFMTYCCSLLVAGDADPWQKWPNDWKWRNQSYFFYS